jgi:glycosyltransferase involved in cell wall biosynthesis
MTILVVSDSIPTPDRSSGDLRFMRILEWISAHEKVCFAYARPQQQRSHIEPPELDRYRSAMEALGIQVVEPDSAMGPEDVRCILFEFHGPTRRWLVPLRKRHPAAAVLVDSVDVHYAWHFAQAKLTRSFRNLRRARRVRARELAAYRAADMVIVINEEDERILLRDAPGLRTFSIPNVHRVPSPDPTIAPDPFTLVFVGSFAHGPNVDAMLWFCGEVLPLIAESVPEVRLKINGSYESQVIRALASLRVEVLGFVPNTTPHLRSSAISIAPLRFGAGMKGKIGEALSLGIPVVSTSVGISGFGLTPGVNGACRRFIQGFCRCSY